MGKGDVRMARPQAFWQQRTGKYAAVYGLLAAIALYPILMVSVPNLVDYPNHLARMYILAHYNDSEALRRFYQVQWRPFPYLGMDTTVILLSRIFPIYVAGRIFVGLCVLLPALSVFVLHFSIHKRLSLVPTLGFLFSYNALLLWGFLDYLPTLCLAVIVFAGWMSTTHWPRWRRLLVFSALALALYLGHLIAFGAYCLLVLCFEVFRAARAGLQAWRAIIVDWLFAALQAVPGIVLALITIIELASSSTVEGSFVGPTPTVYGNFPEKILALLSPILFSQSIIEVERAFAMMIVAVIILRFARLTGRIRLAPEVLQIFLVVAIISLFIPVMVLGTFGLDFRLPLLGAIMFLSAISTTERLGRVFKSVILCGVILLTGARSVEVSGYLRNSDRQIAELRRVLEAMPKGMRMLAVESSQAERSPGIDPAYVTPHAPLLAVIDRDAFEPNLFASYLGVVHPKPEFKMISTPRGHPYPNVAQLVDGYGQVFDPHADISDGLGGRIYWLGWQRNFDYVLVMHYRSRPASLPGILQLVASSNIADLYAIGKPGETRPD
jgi:hypothetical protein